MEAWKKAGMSFDIEDWKPPPKHALRKAQSVYTLKPERPTLLTSSSQATLTTDRGTFSPNARTVKGAEEKEQRQEKEVTLAEFVQRGPPKSLQQATIVSRVEEGNEHDSDDEEQTLNVEDDVVPVHSARNLLKNLEPLEESPHKRNSTKRSVSLKRLGDLKDSKHDKDTPVQAALELLETLKPLQELTPESKRIVTQRSASMRNLQQGHHTMFDGSAAFKRVMERLEAINVIDEASSDENHQNQFPESSVSMPAIEPLFRQQEEIFEALKDKGPKRSVSLQPIHPVQHQQNHLETMPSYLRQDVQVPVPEASIEQFVEDSDLANHHSSTGEIPSTKELNREFASLDVSGKGQSYVVDEGVLVGEIHESRESFEDEAVVFKDDQGNSESRYRDEKLHLVENYHKEQSFRDEKHAIVAQMINDKPRDTEPVRFRIPTEPSSMLQRAQSAQSLHSKSPSNSRPRLRTTLSRLLESETQPDESNLPGAFHTEGRAIGQEPSWANRNPLDLLHRGAMSLQPQRSSSFGEDDVESPYLEEAASSSRSPVESISEEAYVENAVGLEQAPPMETVPASTDVSPIPMDVSPVSMDVEMELTRKKRLRIVVVMSLIALVIISGSIVGLVFGLASPVPAPVENEDEMDTCLLSNGELYDCDEDTGLTLSSCVLSRYNTLRAEFLPTIYPNPSAVQSCTAANLALASLASTERSGNFRRGWEERFFMLATLYFSFFQSSSSNWLSRDLDPCDWDGVSCDQEDGQAFVWKIEDNVGHLAGTVPTEIGLLSKLEELEIFVSPDIVGPLPTEIGLLTNLQRLRFGTAHFTGEIPTEIGNLQRLSVLGLSGNRFVGSIPKEIFRCTDLSENCQGVDGSENYEPNLWMCTGEIHLEDNLWLTGTLPTELTSLSNLQYLVVATTSFNESPIPSGLYSLTNLLAVNLHGINLSGTLSTEIGRMQELSVLSLEGNKLSGTLPTEIGNMVSMGTMVLSSNRFEGTIPSEIGRMNNLTTFRTHRNNFEDPLPKEFCPLVTVASSFSSDLCSNGGETGWDCYTYCRKQRQQTKSP